MVSSFYSSFYSSREVGTNGSMLKSHRMRAAMGVVLNDGSADQLKFLERAAECHRKAATAISPAARSRFLDAASQWLSLADSYALSDRSASSTFTQLKPDDAKDTVATN